VKNELEKGFDILAAEVHDAPERHHSIRAVFDHSWDMLSVDERKIFMHLCVFRGGSTMDAAQQVACASLQQLAGLSNKSFLSRNPDSGRLEIHSLLQKYGIEQLERSPDDHRAALEAHAAYFADFMLEREPQLTDRRQITANQEIEVDIENVRAAWQHYLLEKNIQQLCKFITGLWQVYWFHGWNLAGRELFTEAVRVFSRTKKPENVTFKALAQSMLAYFMAWLGLPDRGYELVQESLSVLENNGNQVALGWAYESLLDNAYLLGRSTKESDARDRLHNIALALNDKRLLTLSFYNKSMNALIEGDFSEAKQMAELCMDITEETGSLIHSTFPLIALGHAAYAQGEYREAQRFFDHCLKTATKVNFRWAIANSRKYLGKVALQMDDHKNAEKDLIESLRISKEIGFLRDLINILFDISLLRVAQGESEEAVELLALVSQHPASLQFRWLEGQIRDCANDLLTQLKGKLPDEAYAAALKRGQDSDMDAVIVGLLEIKGE
jgi:tetratricopeptide (TPR) repeat protein